MQVNHNYNSKDSLPDPIEVEGYRNTRLDQFLNRFPDWVFYLAGISSMLMIGMILFLITQ